VSNYFDHLLLLLYCLLFVFLCLSVGHALNEIDEGISEVDEIWQPDAGALLHIINQIGELGTGGPPGVSKY